MFCLLQGARADGEAEDEPLDENDALQVAERMRIVWRSWRKLPAEQQRKWGDKQLGEWHSSASAQACRGEGRGGVGVSFINTLVARQLCLPVVTAHVSKAVVSYSACFLKSQLTLLNGSAANQQILLAACSHILPYVTYPLFSLRTP